jgi:hypothetical protein
MTRRLKVGYTEIFVAQAVGYPKTLLPASSMAGLKEE